MLVTSGFVWSERDETKEDVMEKSSKTERAAAEDGNNLFFVSAGERTRNNGLKVQQGRF